MKNIIQKIQDSATANGLELNISGDKKTRIFYNKVLDKPYKIISAVNKSYLFKDLCNALIQIKKCEFFTYGDNNYKAIFIEGEYKVTIENHVNGYNIICIYKIK